MLWFSNIGSAMKVLLLAVAALAEGCTQNASQTVMPSAPSAEASTSAPACLPNELHGPLVERRERWSLYLSQDQTSDYSMFFLEHRGTKTLIQEEDLLTLRQQIHSDFVEGDVTSIGVGRCGEGLTAEFSRVTCLVVDLVAGADPFLVATRVDAFLGSSHRDLCFGIAIGREKKVTAW